MYTEWLLFDSETNSLKLCQAYDQKDAIRTAISWNVIPRKTDDIRPRYPRNASDNTIMAAAEFQDFMQHLSK